MMRSVTYNLDESFLIKGDPPEKKTPRLPPLVAYGLALIIPTLVVRYGRKKHATWIVGLGIVLGLISLRNAHKMLRA